MTASKWGGAPAILPTSVPVCPMAKSEAASQPISLVLPHSVLALMTRLADSPQFCFRRTCFIKAPHPVGRFGLCRQVQEGRRRLHQPGQPCASPAAACGAMALLVVAVISHQPICVCVWWTGYSVQTSRSWCRCSSPWRSRPPCRPRAPPSRFYSVRQKALERLMPTRPLALCAVGSRWSDNARS